MRELPLQPNVPLNLPLNLPLTGGTSQHHQHHFALTVALEGALFCSFWFLLYLNCLWIIDAAPPDPACSHGGAAPASGGADVLVFKPCLSDFSRCKPAWSGDVAPMTPSLLFFPGPELERHPAGACREHANLHSRLDSAEKVGAVLGRSVSPFTPARFLTVPRVSCRRSRTPWPLWRPSWPLFRKPLRRPAWRPLPDALGEGAAGVNLGEARPGTGGLTSA